MQTQESLENSEYIWFKSAKPLDYSFKSLKTVGELNAGEKPLSARVHGTPTINRQTNRYQTGSLWLNNNNLIHVDGLRKLAERLLVSADYLSWLDLSSNRLMAVNPELLLFPNLTVLYMHNNRISDLVEVYKLRRLTKLLTLTFSGNPLAAMADYRSTVVRMLPHIRKLDNSVVVPSERAPSSPPIRKCVLARLMAEYPDDFDAPPWKSPPDPQSPPPPSLVTAVSMSMTD
ncbi:leucine-rich repeat-containing protein 51-like [Adelges cooleyi]|uniref:leucine-rich repeat-containing protein 51-like n=1 Tax=Adelges cooleyi TaxID=133065 RepID=UPI00217F78D0|nr:leucine-rich repeat-containing protein 51-like [Adelges cooleyi]